MYRLYAFSVLVIGSARPNSSSAQASATSSGLYGAPAADAQSFANAISSAEANAFANAFSGAGNFPSLSGAGSFANALAGNVISSFFV